MLGVLPHTGPSHGLNTITAQNIDYCDMHENEIISSIFFLGCSALVFKLLIDILEGAILFLFLISKHVSNLSHTDYKHNKHQLIILCLKRTVYLNSDMHIFEDDFCSYL